MGTKPVYVESEAKLPASVLRARRAVEDARAYAAKPATENLGDFRSFASAIFGPVLAESVASEFPKLSPSDRARVVSAILAAAGPIAGTYSRYQEAKRLGYLGEILSPTEYRIGKAPVARKPKPNAKPAPDATA